VLNWIARFRALPGFISIAGLDDRHYRRAGRTCDRARILLHSAMGSRSTRP
jgi:hypothetical protein